MLKKRSTKLMCLLIAFLWTTIVVGSSYAYFIDTVNATGNIVTSGNLKAALSWKNPGEEDWKDASQGAIFNYQHWEPGYTDVKYIKVQNTGNLAFQYELNVFPAELLTGRANLLDVLEVYYGENVTGVTRDNYAEQLECVGTLTDLLTNAHGAAFGILLPENPSKNGELPAGVTASTGSVEACMVLHMQETAGNEYQNLTVGDGFKVQLAAAQYMFEKDSFGNLYDQDADEALPELNIPTSMTIDVTPVNGLVPYEVRFNDPVNGVSATVPAGAKMADGATSLKLVVAPKKNSEAKVNLTADEELLAYNVKVEGLAADNTVPVVINMGEVLPNGLNLGNYDLYHVENGATVKMTLVDSAADLDAHNEFTYDPVNGAVSVAMATFSEVALVADTVKPWEGNFDYSWYTNAVMPLAEGEADYVIANADQLAAFGAIVGGMAGQTQDSFAGKTVKLVADVNLGDDEDNNVANKIFYPIGYYNSTKSYKKVSDISVTSTVNSFEGTFDGNGHKIANFYQNTWEMFGDYNDGYTGTPNHYKDGMGLFGYIVNGTVKNLTVENFKSDGEFTPTGVIAAYAVNSTFENIAITNCNPRVYNTGNGGIVGIGGNSDDPDTYKLTFTNITIDNSNTITALWGSWDVACGGLVGMFRGDGHVYMTNCHVAAQMDVYNDVCGNYQYYWYRYSGMMVGTNKNMTTDANGYTVPETNKFHAKNCTVHFGEWNDYYYCELVANSLASYTHDHQFSRLTEISDLGKIKSGATWDQAGNFLLISGDTKTCYHIVNKNGTLTQHLHTDAGEETVNGETVLKEDKQIVYLPFNQLFTGYGWGVKHIPVYNGEDYAFEGITILDREVADSVEKFETKFTGDFLYRVGNQNTVSLGSLFAAKDGVTINNSGVYVTIDKVAEDMNVSGKFTPNTSDWTKSTIQFSGTGVLKVTIQDYNFCTPTVLYLEVVDAKNITSAEGTTSGGSFVLLCDVNTSSYVNYWNCTLYGNGFTYSLNGAPTAYNSKQGHGILITKNATLDNLVIVGDIYNSYGAYTNQDYYNAAIDVLGDTTIQNCYISGCAAPVSTRANATITNTTLYGGTVANLIIKSGTVTLKDVTTANYADGRSLVGMGIVVHKDAVETSKLILEGQLTQHNFICEANKPNDANAQTLFNAMFDASCSKYHFGTSPNRYVNTGIVSMSEKFNAENIRDNANTGYVGANVTVNNSNGYVYTQPNTSGAVDNSYSQESDPHMSTTQGPAAPEYSFDYTTKNYKAKTDGSNDYCYEENGTVHISMDEGNSFDWDTSILTATKLGQNLNYTVSMNGTDYTNKSITFKAAGSYEVKYSYTDTNNYKMDAVGNITSYNQSYTKTVYISVTTVKADWKNAEIKVTNTAMSGIYVMSGDYDYSYKMKFLDCVTITDYDEVGNASTVDLTKNIKSTSFVDKNGADPGKFDANSGTITIIYNDGKVLTVSIGAWSGSGPSTKTCSVKTDDGVYIITDGASNAANTGVTWKITGYTYTGNNGAVVSNNTTVTFTWDTNSEGYNSKSECVTPDTLITLADGTQVRVDSLTGNEKLLVWNMETGMLDAAPIMFVDSDPEEEFEIVHLYFSDGTDVKVIYEHGFWDYDLNKYVYLDRNAEKYIGHTFAKHSGDALSKVKLTDVVIEKEVTTAWSPVTADHLCYFVNGMLSMPGGVGGLFNIFEVDPATMSYDMEALARDIDTYGLFTYEELNAIVELPEEMFNAAGGAYLKISIGKGNLTMDELIYMIQRYIKYFK